MPSVALSVATVTLGAAKVRTLHATKTAATETTPAEPPATAPEITSTATETKPDRKPETKHRLRTHGLGEHRLRQR
jgi:hypothetical protein